MMTTPFRQPTSTERFAATLLSIHSAISQPLRTLVAMKTTLQIKSRFAIPGLPSKLMRDASVWISIVFNSRADLSKSLVSKLELILRSSAER
jgi:hypothetical protein